MERAAAQPGVSEARLVGVSVRVRVRVRLRVRVVVGVGAKARVRTRPEPQSFRVGVIARERKAHQPEVAELQSAGVRFEQQIGRLHVAVQHAWLGLGLDVAVQHAWLGLGLGLGLASGLALGFGLG